ncbi:CU044_5270 family protein [Actinomadura oligospora]|uniref:CU044_5270 family protein n=1 Tax=Actinomadura oligospora TaxID=111804 RepID=UPI00047CA03D|nr:CU044_5270 family protein [Actinomadura oligospora]
MDELQSVRELFDEPAPPSARVVARARQRATGGSRRRLPRGRWAFSGLGLGLAAAATAVTLVVVDQGEGSGPSGPSGKAPASARQVLLAAADSSARTPGPAGAPGTSGKQSAFWLTQVKYGNRVQVTGKAGPYVVEELSEIRDWTNARSPRRTDAQTKAGRGGTTTHYSADRRLGARPAEAKDVEAWKRDGSPSRWRADKRDLDTRTTPWQTHQEETAFNAAFPDGSLEQVRKLPADPEGLRRYLLAHPDANMRNRQDWESDSQYLLNTVGRMLVVEPVSAQVRAAAYRMLAALPDARMVGQVKDPLGRPGVEVTVEGPGPKPRSGALGPTPGRMESGIVFDPSTGRLLATLDISTGGRAPLPKGTVMSWSAIVQTGWTDKAPTGATKLPG